MAVRKIECVLLKQAFAVAACLAVTGCAITASDPEQAGIRANVPSAEMPANVRQQLSADLASLQDEIAIPVVSGPLPGPLSQYKTFATSTRGGGVMSSPTERAQIVSTIYPGTVLGVSGKQVGSFVEVGYEFGGSVLIGWVDPDVVGLVAGGTPTRLTTKEKQALYERILDRVNGLVSKWADSPYLAITGFSINVDKAPSVNLDIRYK